MDALHLISQHPYAAAVEAVRAVSQQVKQATFDFEPAANLLGLMAQLASKATLNGRLMENAQLVINRYADKIDEAQSMKEIVQNMRRRFAVGSSRPTLGAQQRQAGGLTLLTSGTQAPAQLT